MNENKETNYEKSTSIIEDIMYYLVLAFLIGISCTIILQNIIVPERIPDIFGYKLFAVMDDKMEESLYYGDLVISENIETDKLVVGDLVAFRNKTNKVTIHRIIKIDKQNDEFIFTMNTASNEVGDTKFVSEKNIEGIIVNRIENLGVVILIMQDPLIFIFLLCVILSIGLILYYVAQELDIKHIPRENKLENNKTEEKRY